MRNAGVWIVQQRSCCRSKGADILRFVHVGRRRVYLLHLAFSARNQQRSAEHFGKVTSAVVG